MSANLPFNQLTKSRQALVADLSGLTRDRQYGDATYEGKFLLSSIQVASARQTMVPEILMIMSAQYTAINGGHYRVCVGCRAGIVGTGAELPKMHSLGKPVMWWQTKLMECTKPQRQNFCLRIG